MSSIIRVESEEFGRLIHDLEQDADSRKHTTGDAYWQGRADAFRIVLAHLPAFLYINEEETLSLTYEKAHELRGLLPEKSDDRVVHDLDAFLVNVQRIRGTWVEPDLRTMFGIDETRSRQEAPNERV